MLGSNSQKSFINVQLNVKATEDLKKLAGL